MLNDKRGPIGKILQGIRPEHRELWFIFAQFSTSRGLHSTSIPPVLGKMANHHVVYSCIFMLPPATLFIHSSLASATFLIIIFTVSAWNGATFYVEVFGRKCVGISSPSPLPFVTLVEYLTTECQIRARVGASSKRDGISLCNWHLYRFRRRHAISSFQSSPHFSRRPTKIRFESVG